MNIQDERPRTPQEWAQKHSRTLVAVTASAVAGIFVYGLRAWDSTTVSALETLVGVLSVIVAIVVISRWATPVPVPTILSTTVTVAILGSVPDGPDIETALVAVINGVMLTLAICVPVLIIDAIRQRRRFTRRGWDLADEVARDRRAAIDAALQRERMTVAADMHDGLGHRLTLLTIQLGRIGLAEDLPPSLRQQVEEARNSTAEAVDELGTSVALLRDADHATRTPLTVESVLDTARQSGLEVAAELDDDTRDTAVEATVSRLLQEALTNAARHAPGAPVQVRLWSDGDSVRLTVRNPLVQNPAGQRRSGGFGLLGMRQRVALLGGSFEQSEEDGIFALSVTLPRNATPSPLGADDTEAVAAAHQAARTKRARAGRSALVVPTVLLVVMAVVAAAFFVLSTYLSVLPQDEFADISPGDDQSQVEKELPAMEMTDAPHDEVTPEPGEECRFYEEAASPFERVQTNVVCFADDKVSRTVSLDAP